MPIVPGIPRSPRLPAIDPGRGRRVVVSRLAGVRAEPRRDAAGRAGTRPQQPRHAGRRLEPDRQRARLELLRPADDLRGQDAAGRHRLVRPRHAGAGTRRELAGRLGRHVVHLQAAQGRDLPRRFAGHRQGREVVVRPRGLGRRLSDLPDVGRQPRKARAVRRGRRPHLPGGLHPQGQDADVQSRGRRAVRDQFGDWRRSTPPRPTRGRSPGSRPTRPAAAPSGSKAGSPAARRSSPASTTGRAARCRRSGA